MVHIQTSKYNKAVEIQNMNSVHILNTLRKEMLGDGALSREEICELWKVAIQKVQRLEIIARIADE